MKRTGIKFVFMLFLTSTGGNLFSQDAYHSHWYNFSYNQDYIDFFIYGDISLKQFYRLSDSGEAPKEDKIEFYYVLQLYEPITFAKGLRVVTVEEIQLIFSKDDIKKGIDLDWGGHIIYGKVYFAETGHHHTPVIMVVDEIAVNG
jgi:hypothetical protein